MCARDKFTPATVANGAQRICEGIKPSITVKFLSSQNARLFLLSFHNWNLKNWKDFRNYSEIDRIENILLIIIAICLSFSCYIHDLNFWTTNDKTNCDVCETNLSEFSFQNDRFNAAKTLEFRIILSPSIFFNFETFFNDLKISNIPKIPNFNNFPLQTLNL